MTTPSPSLALRPTQIAAFSLEILSADPNAWAQELDTKLAQAPQMLRAAGLVLSLDKYPEHLPRPDLASLIELLRARALQTLGIRGLRADEQDSAQALGLLALSPAPASPRPENNVAPTLPRPSLVIDQPVRSGQQIYAQGCDLILTATVNVGAEVVADGHIHVYAALRGRALAGVGGDAQSRIYCRQLEAELVAVAGRYLIAETLQEHPLAGHAAQIQLHGDQLHIVAL